MMIDSAETVGQLAVMIPGATQIFEQLQIDYCCKGNQTLLEACTTANIPIALVIVSLQQAEAAGQAAEAAPQSWQHATLTELIAHILETHHVYTRAELERLESLLAKVVSVHEKNHPELAALQKSFFVLKQDLLPHMYKEEQVLFPYLMEMEALIARQQSVPRPFFGSAQNPIRMMMLEHDAAGEALREMRALTQDYRLPADACPSYHNLYSGLAAFEADLHRHIHLENNLLFPRALAIESRAASATVA